jgi:hypothetical protein
MQTIFLSQIKGSKYMPSHQSEDLWHIHEPLDELHIAIVST